MEIGEFHWANGLYFKRNEDGSVRIRKEASGGGSDAISAGFEYTIPAAEWASIISWVAAHGETGESYSAAQRFHAGEV